MMRLGFGARLLIIFGTSLLALQLIAVAAYLLQRSRATESGLRLPLPDQAAALVELLEKTPRPDWPLVLRAANGTDLRVSVAEQRRVMQAAEWSEAPLAEFILRRYMNALGPRDVRVRVQPSSELFDQPLRFFAWISPGAMEIEIPLRDGPFLIVSAEGFMSLSLLGLPPGFWAGVFGVTIAAGALFLLRRETRPLRDLATAVDRLDVGLDPATIPENPRSAPEIRGVVAAFNRLSERVADLIRARMALVGGISHDLRTYVTRLRLRAESISSPDERARAIQDLEDMSRLLDDSLLAFSAGARPGIEELVDLVQLLDGETKEFQSAGYDAHLMSGAKTGEEIPVIGDAVALRRLFANLLDNAIKYGERARVGLETQATSAVICIDDDGPGIPQSEREVLLEPFVRREASRNRQTGGSGLGLAIARSVAASHGGTLVLESAPSGGTRVTVRLPLYVP